MDAAGYGQYAAVRPESSGVNIPQAELLQIQPRNTSTPYGLHPELSDIHPLFAQGRMAILANVGTLVVPTTKAQYTARSVPLPPQLFSHNDQQVEWQSSVPDKPFSTGWGGRLADLTNAFKVYSRHAIESLGPLQACHFNITIEREGREQQVQIRSARLPEIANGHAGIGVFLTTRAFDVELPFEIDFERTFDVGGPSAGLTYALVIADMLDERDYARGRTIAATGEIGLRGDVAIVGGVASKAVAAEGAGADIFFVPGPQVDEAGVEIEVRGVGSLADALGVLAQS